MAKKANTVPSMLAALLDKPPVRLGYGLLGLVLAYVFALWAIDSGSLLDYAITILLAVFGMREVVGALHAWWRGREPQSEAKGKMHER